MFVDYGNFDFISLEDMRPLEPKFLQMELLAVRGGLYGNVSPLSSLL